MSGGGRLQNAKLGDGGSDEFWHRIPDNGGSVDINGLFVGGSKEFEANNTGEFNAVELDQLLFGGTKTPPDRTAEFKGDIDNDDPVILWLEFNWLPSPFMTFPAGNTLNPPPGLVILLLGLQGKEFEGFEFCL